MMDFILATTNQKPQNPVPAHRFDGQVGVLEKTRVDKPPLYRVLLMNDDYTPMDFVIEIIVSVFHKSPDEASKIMWAVHSKGSGVCGIFPKEIAELKRQQVIRIARDNEHPLQCQCEKDE